jgi:putative redox protein
MVSLSLDWTGDLSFTSSAGHPAIALQSSNPAIASPPQALAYAVMGCMGIDLVHVLQKGRHDLRALVVRFEGERASDHPRRFVTMNLHFEVTTSAPAHVVERAIELSRTKYCSVWNTIRPDVAMTTTCTVQA